MNEEKIPECLEGHGEMVPAMGEVKKGEIWRIGSSTPAGKVLCYPFPNHTVCFSDTTSDSARDFRFRCQPVRDHATRPLA